MMTVPPTKTRWINVVTVPVPAHSPTGASVMKRLRNCPGSRRRAEVVPNPTSEYALEGTMAHALAYDTLEARRKGKREPDTFGYTDDMLEAVDIYCNHIIEMGEDGAIQFFEHRFDLSKIYPGCFGTVDAMSYFPKQRLLVVTDYKHGAGVWVDVERNDQLLYYALGAIIAHPDWQIDAVRLEIVQPRYRGKEPIQSWETTTDFIMDVFVPELKAICKASEDPNAPLCAGEWCKFCPVAAADTCPLLKEERKKLARAIFSDQSIQEVNIDELAKQLAWIPVFQAQFKLMHELAYTLATKGQKIPGWKLVEKETRREFVDKEEAYFDIRDKFDIKIMQTKEVYMSPSQIENLSKKDRNGYTKKEIVEFLEPLWTRKSAGFALVPETDERPPMKKVKASAVFTSADEEIDVFQ